MLLPRYFRNRSSNMTQPRNRNSPRRQSFKMATTTEQPTNSIPAMTRVSMAPAKTNCAAWYASQNTISRPIRATPGFRENRKEGSEPIMRMRHRLSANERPTGVAHSWLQEESCESRTAQKLYAANDKTDEHGRFSLPGGSRCTENPIRFRLTKQQETASNPSVVEGPIRGGTRGA